MTVRLSACPLCGGDSIWLDDWGAGARRVLAWRCAECDYVEVQSIGEHPSGQVAAVLAAQMRRRLAQEQEHQGECPEQERPDSD